MKDVFLKFVALPVVVLCALGSQDTAQSYAKAVAFGLGAAFGIATESPDDLKAGFNDTAKATGPDSASK